MKTICDIRFSICDSSASARARNDRRLVGTARCAVSVACSDATVFSHAPAHPVSSAITRTGYRSAMSLSPSVRTDSTPSHLSPRFPLNERVDEKSGTRWNASLPALARKSQIANRKFKIFSLLALLTLLTSVSAHAQWLNQSFGLKGGWNAVYFHVDSSHATLTDLISTDLNNPIQEVWLWAAPASVQQFVSSPQQPTESGSQWVVWRRSQGAESALQRLSGNVACLVRVNADISDYTWNVKGKPVPPQYQWTTTGLNFVGFPTPGATPPSFESFLAKAPSLTQGTEIYRYPGGELGANNPVRVFTARTTSVRRGEAVWIRTGTAFNRYFGPFEVQLQSHSGASFGDTAGQYQFRLRNTTASQVTVTLNVIASEAPPSGQSAIIAVPPLLVRGALNTTNLTYGHTSLNGGPQSWVLAPSGQTGSDIQVIIGLNRSAMNTTPGAFYAGILRFTDNFGLSQIDVPTSAQVSSPAGLWVGGASISSVGHYLKKFAQATNQVDFANVLARLQLTNGANGINYTWDPNSGRILAFGGTDNKTGSYVLDGPIKTDSGAVAQPFPLRLIVHNDGTANRLFQQIFYGIGLGTNPVITAKQNLLLSSALASARRITAVHLPASVNNTSWSMTGSMQQGNSLTTTLAVSHDDQLANPFLHSYHPDHDNVDALFATAQPRGVESYGISRQITLNFTAPANDFDSLTASTQTFSGNYVESVTFLAKGSDSKTFQGLGSFTLKRISNIATLTQ
jgi:hypothetical protein